MGINLGQTPMTAVYLGQTAVKSVFFGNKQVWSLGPVVPKYDIQSIGRSTSQQGTSIEITEQAGDTITLYIKTNATDLTGKQVCVAVYTGATEVTPYASFAFSNVSLVGRYITGTTPDVSTWVPSGFPETYSTLYMKTWIQDTGDIDPSDALGEVLDWTGEEPEPAADWLCFTAEQANSTLRLDRNGSPNFISIETSTNGSTWTDYSWTNNTGDTLTLANVGDKVYMRAKSENRTIGNGDSNYYQFKMTGRIAASGNIQTLLKSSGDVYAAPRYCYRNIFKGCTSLTTAPDLLATTLADHCYMDAFNGCTALTATPKLPATTLGTYCYQGTFSGCTSLTKVEALPATTLATYCYCWMFGNCTSLTTAPELPATTVPTGCYENMFNGCRSLSSIVVAFSTWPQVTTNWLKYVASSGTFTCPAALPDRRGSSNIPTGWTKVDAA